MAIGKHSSTRSKRRLAIAVCLALAALGGGTAHALKFAPRVVDMVPDPHIPTWIPAKIHIAPREELHSVGADVMDEMTLGWVKLMRRAYPHLSVTMEARASGSGVPALTAGTGDLAPVGREALEAEENAFVARFGYAPTRIRVATGSVGTLGKTASSVILVDKDNPIDCLSLKQLDQIYSTSHKRGGEAITRWGQLGATGAWANRPIHLYGLEHPNGIESYFNAQVMENGTYRTDIEFVHGRGYTHAFNVAAEDMARHPGGLTYAMLANLTPNTKVLKLSEEPGGPCVYPTTRTVYDHSYPLSRYVYIYVNKKPGVPIKPTIKEFLRAVLSYQGQQQVADDGVYIPLQPQVVAEELAKVNQL